VLIQRDRGHRFLQRIQAARQVQLHALEPDQRPGKRVQPARFHAGLAREAKQAVEVVCGYAQHAVIGGGLSRGRCGRRRFRRWRGHWRGSW
jgi:hypothetical protein